MILQKPNKSSTFQVVKGIIIAKSAVNITTNTSRNIVPIEKKSDHLRVLIEERNRLDTFNSTSAGWET